MTWLWFVGPLVVGLVYALTNWRDHRREIAIEQWHAAARKTAGVKRVTSMPGVLSRILEATGGGSGGEPLGYFELVPKLAYLAVMGADALQGSEHQSVVARLDEPSPTFTVRPLPIIEGERMANTGVQFKKDPDFMALFLVERGLEGGPPVAESDEVDKAIRKWLSPPLREALLELESGWLRVDGKAKVMAFTHYGPVAPERVDELIAAADIVFAEYGADGGPSLLGDDEEEDEEQKATGTDGAKAPSKVKVKGAAAKPSGAKPAKAAKPAKKDGARDGASSKG